ncbi:DUF3667 domain-containing protein [uncultured Flavobacterium sp.]|uniref:DUF3667 domain-containing protein n=1 Tax=uncultured Flavobacterium sp. TaxID=165435 RepID=UPI00260014C7|nr:DUF3667 domain-containing protein [uncultured Flavobacterium sp.]
MKSHVCLNCNEATERNYCSNCGQKTDTHRINFKHFLVHDILHGVWHVEKGILFTMKEALTRPGKAALDYISGKRIKYYNVFYLTILLVGLQLFLANYYDKLQLVYYPEIYETVHKKSQNPGAFLSDYSKILILSLIPLFALTSFLLFRRKKLNLSEHFILSGMIFLGVMLITLVSTILSFVDFLENFSTIGYIIDRSTPVVLLLYISYGYYNAFQSTYSKSSLIFKIIAFDILLLLEICFFLITLFFIFNKIL